MRVQKQQERGSSEGMSAAAAKEYRVNIRRQKVFDFGDEADTALEDK